LTVRPHGDEVGRSVTRSTPRDGDELGEATYAEWINPGEMIHFDAGKKLRVLDVVPVEEEDSPFTSFLEVEPA
jgi:hypothetical protein